MKKHLCALAICIHFVIFISFLPACQKGTIYAPFPKACISGVPDSASVGQSVTFTSCSSGATSLTWVFGDSTAADTVTTLTATHTYTKAGTFTVSLTPHNSTGSGTPLDLAIQIYP